MGFCLLLKFTVEELFQASAEPWGYPETFVSVSGHGTANTPPKFLSRQGHITIKPLAFQGFQPFCYQLVKLW